jgi:ABC-type antimicrobial peptide transport system permease subunit
VTTLSKQVESSLTGERTLARVTGTFGVVALLLACVGLYGVMSYGVVRRTAELGVRLALGAPRSRVVWMILRESLVLAGIGLLFGMPAVFAAGKLLRGILYGIDPVDPATIAAATAILVSVTALAGGIPAWRASRVDPTVALRYE